ncbi:hypothetical protein [Bacillus mesophilum]|uniref:Uncharacterized protein n=1 Tax=Bacillus mesophilum TaxID=1071718 RepID=A0A7V7RQE6_9BACI|nr:hypothetical protein [Bacillus mesophilum]KAB2335593.1 hypothetical protein F7732_03195 [Bacillus mesophilum]
MKKKKHIVIALISGFLILLSFKLYNDYKEKGLDEIMNYDESNYHSLVINFDLVTNQKKYADELTEFLSQYRVKKMRNSEWDADLSGTKGFHATLNSTDDIFAMASIYENRVLDYSGSYYKVLNGPVDMNWVHRFIEKMEQQQ